MLVLQASLVFLFFQRCKCRGGGRGEHEEKRKEAHRERERGRQEGDIVRGLMVLAVYQLGSVSLLQTIIMCL